MRVIQTLLLLIAYCASFAANAGQTQLTWYGHSAFKLTTPSGKILLIDPWIDNPANKNGKGDMASIDKTDLILVTHGHSDHVGNSADLGKKTKAKLVATFDLAKAMVQYAGYPKEQMGFDAVGHFGGEISLLDGEVKVAFIPAVHGSGIEAAEGTQYAGTLQNAGTPGGFLITVKNGPSIYHTGDTDVFADMSYVSRFHRVDVMLACIGDKFTMGPDRAALATKLVSPKMVIPMHYGTFPVLTGTPEAFSAALAKQKTRVKLKVMQPGESIKL